LFRLVCGAGFRGIILGFPERNPWNPGRYADRRIRRGPVYQTVHPSFWKNTAPVPGKSESKGRSNMTRVWKKQAQKSVSLKSFLKQNMGLGDHQISRLKFMEDGL